jgi:hypothetical protein
MTKTLRYAAVTAAIVIAPASRAVAQIFSPGPLGKAHAHLEGMSNCTECHDVGKKVDGALCLKCHKELAEAISGGQGYHAALKKEGKSCISCHKDHRGENATLAIWPAVVDKFDHSRTGWTLVGRHAKAKCDACHRAELIKDPALKKRLSQRPSASYLGLSTGCPSCHFDEHRGQLGRDCDRCHDSNAFKPAGGFKHEKSFKLTGAHERVECLKCHPVEADTSKQHWLPAPVKPESFARYTSVGKGGCVGCHKDVHVGKFGRHCESCHTTDSWTRTHIANKNTAFHDKTRYPLKGLHQTVACDRCHPKSPKGGIQNKGFPFAHCNDCHLDAHFDQIAKDAAGFVPCERCHDEEGFFPPSYAVLEHDKSRYPLKGAHRASPCNACHKAQPEAFAEKIPARFKAADYERRGTELLNFTRIKLPEKELGLCDSCHEDPHAGQFARGPRPRACADCHKVSSFTDVRFNHSVDSTFALVGKHAKAGCGSCHRPRRDGTSVVYRGTPRRCADCHVDPHLGQFRSQAEAGKDCDVCHGNDGYKPTLFSHDDERFTTFKLTGKHLGLACGKCHPKRSLNPGVEAVWYRGVPDRCDACHENVHSMGTGGKR